MPIFILLGCVQGIPGSFQCICHWGFTGKLCESRIDKCASVPCLNGGTCQNTIPGYFQCICPFGYAGTLCQVKDDPCRSWPCRHGGTCLQRPHGQYACICPNGTSGQQCEMDINECISQPCLNGGRCSQPKIGEYNCDCDKTGFMGKMCEIGKFSAITEHFRHRRFDNRYFCLACLEQTLFLKMKTPS